MDIVILLVIVVLLIFRPVLIPYLGLAHLFVIGLASPAFIDKIKVVVGRTNIFPLDLLYVVAALFAIVYFVKIFFSGEFKKINCAETKGTGFWVLLFLLFFFGKFVNGMLDNLPKDTIVRLFAGNTQALYFFLPLVVYKNIKSLRRLMIFVVLVSLVFPLCQPLLIGAESTDFIMRGQGTFRLGHGDANILLALGAIALICWEYKKFLAFLPVSGIMMLAHRSGYIGIVISLLALSFLKGKKIKSLMLIAGVGVVVIGMLAALQAFTKVNILEQNLSRAEETFKATNTTMARVGVYTVAFEELQIRPFTGLTYSEYQEAVDNSGKSPRSFNMTHPHNFVLYSLMNAGLLGTGLLFMLIFKSLRMAYRLAKTSEYKSEGAYLFSAILFFIIFSAMNTTMETTGYILWYLCGTTFWYMNQYKALAYQR